MNKKLIPLIIFFILVVVGSVLIMCVKAKWSTMALKSTHFNRYTKLAIFMAKPHISNSVIE